VHQGCLRTPAAVAAEVAVSADDPSYSLHQIPPLTNPTNEEELMADLSPAAQAVLDATDYPEDWATRIRVAAALRAAADQVVPATTWPEVCKDHRDHYTRKQVLIRDKILAIAAELRAK
jgi:hypothetical protein